MSAGVTHGTERDEVPLGVIAGVAAKLFVMDFHVRHRSARLIPPAIATQHLLAKVFVGHCIQPKPGRVGAS
jgi:hypothetical protein